jgi:predicted ATPase
MLIKIKNFRAIQDQEVKLAPITVVYGANGAGKSSLLYALQTLKNAVFNSNLPTSGFFNFGFTSLGGFDAVVFDHNKALNIDLKLQIEAEGGIFEHGVKFNETQGAYTLAASYLKVDGKTELPVTFPYPANAAVTATSILNEEKVSFVWNGITAQMPPTLPAGPEELEALKRYVALLNGPAEELRKVSMVPLRRGFSKPIYTTTGTTAALITEEEVASFLSANKYLEGKISHYLEKVLNLDFRVHVTPGTAIFSLDATDKKTGITTELVNEGFGVNQMVYFLAKALNPDTHLTCIEEPEIHLHPSAVRTFARAMAEMVNKENKVFLVSTHSEAFVLALLSLVAEGGFDKKQLACYYVKKEGRKTIFEPQTVHENGQIEGGLTSFMGGEIEDLKSLLKHKE